MNLLEFVISSASSTGADLILWTALSSLVAKQKFIQMIKKSSNKERSRCEQRRRRWRGEIKFWTIWDEKQKGNLIAMSLYLPSQRCHFTCYLLLASLPPSTRNKNVWISLLRSRLVRDSSTIFAFMVNFYFSFVLLHWISLSTATGMLTEKLSLSFNISKSLW